MKGEYKKWDSKGKDGLKLRMMLFNGKINPHTKPSIIRDSLPEFQQYNPNSFRQAFYRMREEVSMDKLAGKKGKADCFV
jgi:hypothetical protein